MSDPARMHLYETIRLAAADNRLDGLSVRRDPSGRGWQASAPSPYQAGAWSVAISTDPIVALLDALQGKGAAVPAPVVSAGVFD